ncbi:MAG: class I SAM-dependent methyltransferase [Bryobacterales bacterium]
MSGPTERFFERKVLAPLEEAAARPLRILEIGASAGWFTPRLAARGHQAFAVDLRTAPNAESGPRARVALESLPFPNEQFDLAVFRASFHLAVDYRATLREVRRVLGWGGRVVILDTPVYHSYRDGEQMRERRLAQMGTQQEPDLSMGYLDQGMIEELRRELNLRWSLSEPWRGLGYWLAPLRAKLTGERPPVRYTVLAGSWT